MLSWFKDIETYDRLRDIEKSQERFKCLWDIAKFQRH